MIKKVRFKSDIEITGKLYYSEKSNNPGILFLHGGGKSSKESFSFTQEILYNHGISSLAIDFCGVGESAGDFESGSLKNRLIDAKRAYDFLKKYAKSIFICGYSMGGHTAVELTSICKIEGLVLVSAAAYSKEAESKLFNESFTEILHKKDSWANSPVFAVLKKFKKSILLIYSENDSIIPLGVIEKYTAAAGKFGELVNIKNGDHQLFNQDTITNKQIVNKISILIRKFVLKTN